MANSSNELIVDDIPVGHNEETLVKVYKGLLEAGVYGQQALDVVNSLQNQGILFRESVKLKRGRPKGSRNTPKPTDEKDAAVIVTPGAVSTVSEDDPWSPPAAQE